MDLVLLLARIALAAVFLVAGGAKLADLPGSRKAVAGFGVPERLAPAAGLALPIAELLIGLALIPAGLARWGALAALALLLAFIGAIGYNLARGRTPDCHCFGQIHSAPAGPSTIARNGGLAAIALFILVAGWGDPGASAVAWLGDLAAIDIVLLAGGLLILGVLGVLGWATVNLMSQNGRLLTRLDALEAAIATGADAPTRPPEPTLGLPVGTPAPAFALPDVLAASDAPVTLDTLRAPGAPLLLLFTDPGCGPCNQALREFTRWREAAGPRLDIVVISRGAREANLAKAREHRLDRLLLQQSREAAEAYGAQGTPAAVIVRADGTIGTPLAGGLDAIRALVAATLGAAPPASAALPPPTPQPIAGPAPDFRLPDLDGDPVALGDLRRPSVPTLLFFTDPRCGPCQELLPEVVRWERDYGDRLAVTVIGNGDAAATREHIAPHGFSRVLVQREMEVAVAYGVAKLPAAVVIDAEGSWNGTPAFGEGAIRHLVASAVNAPELAPAPTPAAPTGPSIALGEPTPSIVLPNLDGSLVDLADESARDKVLLFWNPACGFCQRMVNDLKTWESQRAEDSSGRPELVVISAGSAEGTRAHGFASTVLLDDGRGVGRRFGAQGTPAAVRIDREGRVASPVAAGATAAFGLLRAASPASVNGQRPG